MISDEERARLEQEQMEKVLELSVETSRAENERRRMAGLEVSEADGDNAADLLREDQADHLGEWLTSSFSQRLNEVLQQEEEETYDVEQMSEEEQVWINKL